MQTLQNQSQMPQLQANIASGNQNDNSNKNNNNNFNEQDEKTIKELLFSGGAGGIAFQAGFTKALIEIVGKDKLKEYRLGGVSCGCTIAVITHMIIHSNNPKIDMEYFYNKLVRKTFQVLNKEKFYGFMKVEKVISENSTELINFLLQNSEIPSLKDRVHLTTSVFSWRGLKKTIINQLETEEDFRSGALASCGIPFLLNKKFFQSYQGQWALDGGITAYIPNQFENSQKIFVNIGKESWIKVPFIEKTVKNVEFIQAAKGSTLSFPRDYWIWDENWADEMYKYGYERAMAQKESIIKSFARVDNNQAQILKGLRSTSHIEIKNIESKQIQINSNKSLIGNINQHIILFVAIVSILLLVIQVVDI